MPGIPMVNRFEAFAAQDATWQHGTSATRPVRPWPLAEIVSSAIEEPAICRVMKMRFGRNDRTEDKTYIVYNSHITLTGIPEARLSVPGQR